MTSHANGNRPLVLGGRGFVGAPIVRALIQRGDRPHVYGPMMPGDNRLADLGDAFDETLGSIEDAEPLTAALAASGARQVISTAAFSVGHSGLMRAGEQHHAKALAVNVTGFNTLLEVAQAAGVRRLIWTSSTTVYGDADQYPDPPVDEEARLRPQTFYGLTKVLAEQLARHYRDRTGMEIVALRLPLVLGRGLWYQGAAAALADLLRTAAPEAVYPLCFHDQPMDLMDVRDVARAVLAALDARTVPASVYNINGFTATAADLARAAEHAVPGYRVALQRIEPPRLFPLISDARFRAALRFAPAYDLNALVADMTGARQPQEPSP